MHTNKNNNNKLESIHMNVLLNWIRESKPQGRIVILQLSLNIILQIYFVFYLQTSILLPGLCLYTIIINQLEDCKV